MKKIICINIAILMVFLSINVFANIDGLPVWSENVNQCSIPTAASSMDINAKAAILMEANTGKILYEQNCDEKLRPASVTKVMTILLIFESIESGNISLTDIVPCSEKAMSMGGSQIWLEPKDNLTVDDMLKAICVVSANDCCVAMAEYIAGSTESFVTMMNQKAKSLGMTNTNFLNCHGLDEDGHLTSAKDIAIMSRELITKYPQVSKYSTIWMDSLRGGKSELVNTNKLVRTYKGITGLKTGSTSLALYNLSATATRDNLSLIAVVMGAPTPKDRFDGAQRLLDMGFTTYENKELCKEHVVVKNIKLEKGKVDNVDVVTNNSLSILLKKAENKNVTTKEIIEESIVAPIEKNQKVGEIIYYVEDVEIGRVDVVTYYSVERIGLLDCITKVSDSFYKLCR